MLCRQPRRETATANPLLGLEPKMTKTPEDSKRPPYRDFEDIAEEAYDDMYEGRVAGRWSDIKEYLGMAILSAEREGLTDEAERLRQRLDHIRNVVQRQFS